MTGISFPEDVLKKMVCAICKNMLSIFPVYVKLNSSTEAVCGRCKISEQDKYIRDEAFETLANFMLFPCIYKENGCKKSMVPNLMEKHESCCEYKKYNCPTLIYTKCDWKGPINQLFAHFQERHPKLVMNDQKFEMDFVNSEEECLLMKANEDLFLVKKDINARKEVFICTVTYLKAQETEQTYNFRVKFESNNSEYTFKTAECPADGTKNISVNGTLLREKLHDPPSMFVAIDIFKNTVPTIGEPADDPMQGPSTEKEDKKPNPAVNWELLSEMECPVCLEYMLPPIYQCSVGHSICKNCKPKIASQQCPTCKQEIQATQNFALANMTRFLIYPCKHHKQGCSFAAKAADIEIHEASCEYGPFECPMKTELNCNWMGSTSEILPHVENNHGDVILRNDRLEVAYPLVEETTTKYLMILNRLVFKFGFKGTPDFCQWSVQIVGSIPNSQPYKFEVNLVDTTKAKKKFMISGVVVPVSAEINDTNSIKLAKETIAPFVDNRLSYIIRISKV